MAQVSLLVTELKRYLKAQGVTYAALAARLDLSESSTALSTMLEPTSKPMPSARKTATMLIKW